MSDVLINLISTGLVAILSTFYTFKSLNVYLKTKNVSKLFETLFFIFFSIGWICISAGFISAGLGATSLGILLFKLGIGSITITSTVQIMLSSYLFSPKYYKIGLVAGSVLFIFVLYSLIAFPTPYLVNDFEFDMMQKIAALASSILNYISITIFIIFSRITKNKFLSKKSLLFGIGLFIIVTATMIVGFANNIWISLIFRIVLAMGLITFYVGSSIKKK